MTKNILKIALTALLVLPLGFAISARAAVPPNWNVTGSYVANFNYLSTNYPHDISLTQDMSGNLTGSGGNPAGGTHVNSWVTDSGSVSGNAISFTAHYTAPAAAVTPLTTMTVNGTIATSGAMSGTWSDNFQGGARSGTWTTISGTSSPIVVSTSTPSLAAQDFGVVNYDTGTSTGMLKGYTAGFGLTNTTFANATSVVVKLYNNNQLLQTNTLNGPNKGLVTGNQISSPFDVSGTFNYVTDGYWTNVRESQFGQSLAANKVVATVTLTDGTVLMATNTAPTGDPTTIFATSTSNGGGRDNDGDDQNGNIGGDDHHNGTSTQGVGDDRDGDNNRSSGSGNNGGQGRGDDFFGGFFNHQGDDHGHATSTPVIPAPTSTPPVIHHEDDGGHKAPTSTPPVVLRGDDNGHQASSGQGEDNNNHGGNKGGNRNGGGDR